MDDARFDAMSKALAVGAVRRVRRRILAGAVLGAALARRGATPAAAKCRKPQRSCHGRKQCCGGKSGRTACQPLQPDFCGLTRPGRRCCIKAGFPRPADTCGCCSAFSVDSVCRLQCTAAGDCPAGQQCCPIGFVGYCASVC